jgi:hypothetical protein
MGPEKKRRGRPPARHILKPATPPPSDGDRARMQQIQITIPLPHLEILTREADLIGVPRGSLLGMILRKRRGAFSFDRPPSAPTYAFKPKDFEEMVRYTWYVTPELRKMLDQDTLEMGNVTISMWVVSVLNRYVDRAV